MKDMIKLIRNFFIENLILCKKSSLIIFSYFQYIKCNNKKIIQFFIFHKLNKKFMKIFKIFKIN